MLTHAIRRTRCQKHHSIQEVEQWVQQAPLIKCQPHSNLAAIKWHLEAADKIYRDHMLLASLETMATSTNHFTPLKKVPLMPSTKQPQPINSAAQKYLMIKAKLLLHHSCLVNNPTLWSLTSRTSTVIPCSSPAKHRQITRHPSSKRGTFREERGTKTSLRANKCRTAAEHT